MRFRELCAREHGEEMLGTLLDVSATSRTRFVRELVGLVRAGMRARATQTARAGPRRVVADGFCLGGVWLLTLFLASELGNRIRGFDPLGPWDPISPWSLALLGAALALALIGYDRLAGATALLFVATTVADPAWRDLTNSRRELMVVPCDLLHHLGALPTPAKARPSPSCLACADRCAGRRLEHQRRPNRCDLDPCVCSSWSR